MLANRNTWLYYLDKRGAGLSAYTSPTPILDKGREVMQMGVFLAVVQTLIGAATLGVALLALKSGDPPHNGGSTSKSSED